MQDNKSIKPIIILFDHIGNLFLVLNGNIGTIQEFIKLYHFVKDTLLKRGDRRDALVGITAHLCGELLVVQVRINFQSVHETLLRDISFRGVDHGQGTSCADDQDARDLFIYKLVR
jgi:hypothetical protein